MADAVVDLDAYVVVRFLYHNLLMLAPVLPLVGRIQNMDLRSMDHPCGPGPWTTPVDHPSFCKLNMFYKQKNL